MKYRYVQEFIVLNVEYDRWHFTCRAGEEAPLTLSLWFEPTFLTPCFCDANDLSVTNYLFIP
jgi:hypothetical protein